MNKLFPVLSPLTQYQAILMGQGYKRDHLDDAPEKLRHLARVNSGYNVAKAELHELEHQLTYCTITAPVSGYVLKIQNTLYGTAQPGEPLFSIVDIDHLKVSFDVRKRTGEIRDGGHGIGHHRCLP